MPTPARKPVPPPDNLLLIVGQLLEATKAASEGLKSMSAEVQSNAKAIIAAVKTLEKVEEKVEELDVIIRDSTNQGNLVALTQTHTAELASLTKVVVELRTAIDRLKLQMGQLGMVHARISTTRDQAWAVIKIVAWVVTTLVACWGAWAQGQR